MMKVMVVKSFYNLIGLQSCLNLDYYKKYGYKQLEINKIKKGETNMNEKTKRVRYVEKIPGGYRLGRRRYVNEDELNVKWWFEEDLKSTKERTNMNEKMKRDLIKLLFEKELYNHELDGMRKYKGRIIFDYFHRSVKFIDFIEMINENYNIKGYEVAEIIIEEFDIKEYSED